MYKTERSLNKTSKWALFAWFLSYKHCCFSRSKRRNIWARLKTAPSVTGHHFCLTDACHADSDDVLGGMTLVTILQKVKVTAWGWVSDSLQYEIARGLGSSDNRIPSGRAKFMSSRVLVTISKNQWLPKFRLRFSPSLPCVPHVQHCKLLPDSCHYFWIEAALQL